MKLYLKALIIINFFAFLPVNGDVTGNPITANLKDYEEFLPTTLQYIKIALDLRKRFGDLNQMHIVEIGGGYGGQCKVISDLFGFASYTIVDSSEQISLASKYLSNANVKNVNFIESSKINKVYSFDLVIANVNDVPEDQKKVLEYLILPSKNGYMTGNFSGSSNKIPLEELIAIFLKNKKIGRVENELPYTQSKSLIFSWKNNQPISQDEERKIPKLEKKGMQKGNAISYPFINGRMGDYLIGYFHAKWYALKHNLPFLYTPFINSEHFAFDNSDQRRDTGYEFKNVVTVKDFAEINASPSSTLYLIPYYPECQFEYLTAKYLPNEVDWTEPTFKNEVIRSLQPKNKVETLNLPKDQITVGVHIRRGSANIDPYSFYHKVLPLKFPADEYYIDQLKFIEKIFQGQELYVFLFTDDVNPKALVEKYQAALNNPPNMKFDYRKENNGPDKNLLEDFYSFLKFDCLIICQSNFSVIPSRMSEFKVLITPLHAVPKNGGFVVDEVGITFNGSAAKI